MSQFRRHGTRLATRGSLPDISSYLEGSNDEHHRAPAQPSALRVHRIANGLRQRELAALAGLSELRRGLPRGRGVADGRARPSGLRRSARGHEHRLVGEHDRLDAVAEPELHQRSRHRVFTVVSPTTSDSAISAFESPRVGSEAEALEAAGLSE